MVEQATGGIAYQLGSTLMKLTPEQRVGYLAKMWNDVHINTQVHWAHAMRERAERAEQALAALVEADTRLAVSGDYGDILRRRAALEQARAVLPKEEA
jgi:hypothetical protein